MKSYYGLYRSGTAGQTGCVKEFLTEPVEDTGHFHPQLQYLCDLCHCVHSFRLIQWYNIVTPNQARQLESYCDAKAIERDIALP